MNKKTEQPSCSFCGRTEDVVEKLISGPSAYICDKCVGLCVDIVQKKPASYEMKLLKPREIKAHLEVLNGEGKRIEGFSAEDAIPIHGDALNHSVKWQAHTLNALPDAHVMLRLHLNNTAVYALNFLP